MSVDACGGGRQLSPMLTVLGSLLLVACSSLHQRPPETPATADIADSEALMVAMGQLGAPYRYGGASPERGFDCSGLVYYVLRQSGTEVPRLAGDQYADSVPVGYRDLRPGDLVFFRTEGFAVSHVGIYLGNGQFIHAPSTGRFVTIERLDRPYWRERFVRGGRVSHSS